jgi:hypothetical protein
MTTSQNERFGVLRVPRRIWAVSAIHGEAERLAGLHEQIAEHFTPGDRLVYMGNYLGHGPRVVDTLDELLWFRSVTLYQPGMEPWDIVYLRGGQEEMWHKLLQIQFAANPSDVFDWMMGQGALATLEAYGGNADGARAHFREGPVSVTRWTTQMLANVQAHPGHYELLTGLKRAAYTEGQQLLFVHAGVDPHRPLSEQGDTLWWGSGYFNAIDEPFDGFDTVVRGYDPKHGGVTVTRHAVTVDDRCGFGGPLRAACFGLDGRVIEWLEA